MRFRFVGLVLLVSFCGRAVADDLATAPTERLLDVYKQLRTLQGSDQGAAGF